MPLLLQGYGWLPSRLRRSKGDIVQTRLMGMRAVGLRGPDAARFFYDEDNVRRETALPEPVLSTLFGHHAVHTLDGGDHRRRKELFLPLTGEETVRELVDEVCRAWDDTVAGWRAGRPVVLFDEAAHILTRGVCRWAGVPLGDREVAGTAADLVAMVDGFATASPRHVRARLARRRQENRLARLVRDARAGAFEARSALRAVSEHRDADGTLLDPRTAAVELLNMIRPTVAVSWFVAFSAHALQQWPAHREALRAGDDAFAEAFAHEVRRFYPFAPFVAGRAARDLTWHAEQIPRGAMVMIDVFGQHHDPAMWDNPYTFDPRRFVGHPPGVFDLIPQGGGDPATGHRCPGEPVTVALLAAVAVRLARLDYDVPEQDLSISLRRMPTRPRSGFVLVPRVASDAADQETLRLGGSGR